MKDFEDDRSAILAVIERETRAYLQRDFHAWERCWHDGPEIRRIHAQQGTGVTVVQGAAVRQRMHKMLSTNTDCVPRESIRRENFNVVISPEMAWVSYDQFGDMSGVNEDLSGHYHELKILQKFQGRWKLTCIVGTQMGIGHVRAPLIEVDENARILWLNESAEHRLRDHPRLRKRGNRLQATSTAAQDELLQAITTVAASYHRHFPCAGHNAVTRAVALGQDDTGLAHICWAVLRDGKFLITFDDSDLLDRQIASAAKIYALSRTQEKLACEVIAGRDLTTAAATLGISPNTAKTHLQRIYDKIGVRTQPALVRLLLNADRRNV